MKTEAKLYVRVHKMMGVQFQWQLIFNSFFAFLEPEEHKANTTQEVILNIIK